MLFLLMTLGLFDWYLLLRLPDTRTALTHAGFFFDVLLSGAANHFISLNYALLILMNPYPANCGPSCPYANNSLHAFHHLLERLFVPMAIRGHPRGPSRPYYHLRIILGG
ncbi:unnamed protein product [Amoebophrya sp. A25]|nr:unnamed protein product [Amoebophrya sp. A25]|eukprot:GSA25T00009540001.1